MAKSSAEETKCIAEHCAEETADSKQATCACGVSHDDTDKDNREACGIYTSLNSEFASINHSGAATLQGSMLSALVAVAVARSSRRGHDVVHDVQRICCTQGMQSTATV